MTISETRFTLDTADRHTIECFAWTGPGPVHGVVQLVHGMAEHIRRYRHVAEALAAAGYAVVGSDHRGHGDLARAAGSLGDFGAGGFQSLVDDLAVVTHHLRERHPGLPVTLVAHSMGSFAAQLYMLDHSNLVAGIALSGTSALELLDVRHSGWTVESANASVGTPRTPADWLSRDPAVADAFLADPLCAFSLTEASLFSIFDDGARTTDRAQLDRIRKDLPLFLFTGDRDPVNGLLAWFHPLVDRLRGAGLADVSTHVYGGARHEVFNETNRREVIANLVAWIDRVTA